MGREISRSLPNDFLFVVLGLLSPHCVWGHVLLECSLKMISFISTLKQAIKYSCSQEMLGGNFFRTLQTVFALAVMEYAVGVSKFGKNPLSASILGRPT